MRGKGGYVMNSGPPQARSGAPARGLGRGRGRQSFRRWRGRRPFWGGLLLIVAGVELFLSENLALTALQVHLGPSGFLSYVLPVMLLLCGLLSWLAPAQRLFYGILGTITAVFSLIGLNLGGFFVGLVLGIIGGALTIAWAPAAVPAVRHDHPVADDVATMEQPAVHFDGFGDGRDGPLTDQLPPAHRSPLHDRWSGPRHAANGAKSRDATDDV